MLTLLGQKIGMTQVFAPDGATLPVTVVYIPESRVIALKTVERDGYSAVQVGTHLVDDTKKAARVIAMPQMGHLKKSGVSARTLFEVRVSAEELQNFKPGDDIAFKELQPGVAIDVRGVSKGHGFAGVVKRHHFRGGPASHGHKDNLRAPGSIGAGHPQHVHKGTRMGGHMGDAVTTLKKLEVIRLDEERRIVLIKGCVPGAMRSIVWIVPRGESVANPAKDRKTLPGLEPKAEAAPKAEPAASEAAKTETKTDAKTESKPEEAQK